MFRSWNSEIAEFPKRIIDFWITVPRLRSAQSFFANSSGEFFSSAKSHSNWSTREIFPTCIFNLIMTLWSENQNMYLRENPCPIKDKSAWQLPDDCLTTAWRLPDDCLTTAIWLPNELTSKQFQCLPKFNFE